MPRDAANRPYGSMLDAQSERGAAVLRIAAALVVAVAATWLLALPYAVPRAVAVAGLMFAILWIARNLRVAGRTLDPAEHYLELTAGALCLREGDVVRAGAMAGHRRSLAR